MGITIQQLSVFLENREGRLDEEMPCNYSES